MGSPRELVSEAAGVGGAERGRCEALELRHVQRNENEDERCIRAALSSYKSLWRYLGSTMHSKLKSCLADVNAGALQGLASLFAE